MVSDDIKNSGTLFDKDIQYEDNTYCELFDIVRVHVIRNNPSIYQPENVLIDKRYYWEKLGHSSIYEVLSIHPPEINRYLFGDLSYFINEDMIHSLGYSLTIIKVENLTINQIVYSSGKPKTKASFKYRLFNYTYMSVTDPSYYNVPDGTLYGSAYLVVSLPDIPFNSNQYYKFVAQIYPSS